MHSGYRSLIRIPGRYDSAVWLLTKRFTNALIEIWFILIENVQLDRAGSTLALRRMCMRVFLPPLPKCWEHADPLSSRHTYALARTPEFIYSNLFMFTRDDSVTCIGLDLLHYLRVRRRLRMRAYAERTSLLWVQVIRLVWKIFV